MKQLALVLASSCVSSQGKNRSEGVKPEQGALSGPQTTCPVMEGRRINNRLYVDYQGFRIYACCTPCVKAVMKDPEKYLRKLEEQGVVVEKTEQTGATESDADKAVIEINDQDGR